MPGWQNKKCILQLSGLASSDMADTSKEASKINNDGERAPGVSSCEEERIMSPLMLFFAELFRSEVREVFFFAS